VIEHVIVFNGFTLNNQAIRRDLRQAPHYDWWVQQTQWVVDQKADPQPRPRQVGDYPGLAYRGASRLNMSGVLMAWNLLDLRAGQVAFKAAVWDQAFHAFTFLEWGGSLRTIQMRISQLPLLVDEQTSGEFKRPFTCQFYCADTAGLD
jgi:hypothetical protein